MRYAQTTPLILALLLLAACDATDLPTPPAPAPSASPTALEAELLGLVNEARARGHDCGAEGVFGAAGALTLESRLTAAAQAHADDMNQNGYFGHAGQDGSSVGDRVDRAGYAWRLVGENIGSGYEDAASVTADWLESDPHCANLMKPDYLHMGVGRSGEYWVQVFGRPR